MSLKKMETSFRSIVPVKRSSLRWIWLAQTAFISAGSLMTLKTEFTEKMGKEFWISGLV